MTAEVPIHIYDELTAFRYRERFHLSEQQLLREPAEAISQAAFIWSLDAERDKLEAERAKHKSGRQN